jgi:hypothetical protein
MAQLARCILRVLQGLPVAAELLVLVAQGLVPLLPLVDAAGGALELGGTVVAGEVLAAVAREGAVEMMAIDEGLTVGVEIDTLAVAGHRDVGRVTIHQRVGQGVGAVHSGALALVDGDRVAVADVLVLPRMEGDGTAVVEADGEALGCGVLDGPQRAVLDAEGLGAAVEVGDLLTLVVVAEEHDAVAGGVVPAADRDGGLGELAGCMAGVAHGVVEAAGVGVAVGDDELGPGRVLGAVGHVARHELGAGAGAGVGPVQAAGLRQSGRATPARCSS